MSGFKDMVAADIHNVFLNIEEFADLRTVIYDGEPYEDIPVVLSRFEEKERSRPLTSDHAQGLYLVSEILHCALSDIGGILPKKGKLIKINNREGGGGFFRTYKIAAPGVDMGMARLELEAMDE